jgi:hypothetical protein
MAVLAISEAVLEHRAIGPIGDLAPNVEMFLAVWLVAYSYMWILAVPTIVLTRRWIAWSWWRLMGLGALLAALPWTAVPVSELRGRTDLSFAQLVREFFSTLLFMDGYIVLKFAVLGALVAGAFCLLQLYIPPAPSNNALEQAREG